MCASTALFCFLKEKQTCIYFTLQRCTFKKNMAWDQRKGPANREIRIIEVRLYLQSLPVTTSTSVGNTAVHPEASQAPVLSTKCGLRASAPSFPTGAVTQTVYADHYLEHELSYPNEGESPNKK